MLTRSCGRTIPALAAFALFLSSLLATSAGSSVTATVSAQSPGVRIFLPYAAASPSRGISLDVEHFGGAWWGQAERGSSLYMGHGRVLVRLDRDEPSAVPAVIVHRFASARRSMIEVGGRLLVAGDDQLSLFDIDRAGDERLLWTTDEDYGIDWAGMGYTCRVSQHRVILCWQEDVLISLSVEDSGVRALDSYAPSPGSRHTRWMTWLDSRWAVIGRCCDEDSGGSAGLEIIDVGDPRALKTVGSIPYGHIGLTHMLADDRWLYAGSHYANGGVEFDRLAVFDLEGADSGTQVAELDVGQVDQIMLQGALLYVATRDRGVSIVDVGDPTRPKLTATFSPCADGTSERTTFRGLLGRVGKHLYVTCDRKRAVVVDVSNRAEPRVISRWAPQESLAPSRESFTWSLLETSLIMRSTARVVRIDLSEPASPRVLQSFRMLEPVDLMPAEGGRFWGIDSGSQSMLLLEPEALLGDPAAIATSYRRAPEFPFRGSEGRLLTVDDGVIHLSSWGLGIYGAAGRSEIRELSWLLPETEWPVADATVAGDTVWMLLSGARRLVAVDVRDHSAPRHLGGFDLHGPLVGADSVAAGHGRVYVGTPGHGTTVFAIDDLGRVSGPRAEWRELDGMLLVHGQRLIVIGAERVEVVDPRDVDAPRTIARARMLTGHDSGRRACRAPARAHIIADDILFRLCHDDLSAIDLRVPSYPEPLGGVTLTGPGRLAAEGSVVWVALGDGGPGGDGGLHRITPRRR